MNITKLNPLPIRFHCYKVLPLVYDESLSYYEQLCKVLKTLDDTVIAVNDLNDAVSDIIGGENSLTARVKALEDGNALLVATVNNAISDMNNTLDNYDKRIDVLEAKLLEELSDSVEALKQYVDDAINAIELDVSKLVEKEIAIIYQHIDAIEEDLRNEFEEIIRRLISSIPDLTTIQVINPVKGYLTNVQVALDDIFMNTRYNALTVDEFNHLHLDIDTCNHLMYQSAPTGWSIITWLSEAKVLLDKNPKHRMANPITGMWQDFKKNVEFNTDLLRVCGCLTVDEFNLLGLTVDMVNGYNATCEDLAWKSNRIFV